MDRQRISSGSPWELVVGYSRAVRVGDRVWVAGTAPVMADGGVDPDVEVQLRRCFQIVDDALAQTGGSLDDVVRTRVFLTDPADFDVVARVHGELFSAVRPANTMVVVARLMNPAWRVEVEVDAVLADHVREPRV